MKSSVTALASLLTIAALLVSCSQAQSQLDSSHCCKEYVKKPIPLRLLASFEYANSRCPLPAVIFITKRDRQQCADPSAAWAQERIRSLSQSLTTPSKE